MNSGCLGYDLRHKTLKCITLKNYLVNITIRQVVNEALFPFSVYSRCCVMPLKIVIPSATITCVTASYQFVCNAIHKEFKAVMHVWLKT